MTYLREIGAQVDDDQVHAAWQSNIGMQGTHGPVEVADFCAVDTLLGRSECDRRSRADLDAHQLRRRTGIDGDDVYLVALADLDVAR